MWINIYYYKRITPTFSVNAFTGKAKINKQKNSEQTYTDNNSGCLAVPNILCKCHLNMNSW